MWCKSVEVIVVQRSKRHVPHLTYTYPCWLRNSPLPLPLCWLQKSLWYKGDICAIYSPSQTTHSETGGHEFSFDLGHKNDPSYCASQSPKGWITDASHSMDKAFGPNPNEGDHDLRFDCLRPQVPEKRPRTHLPSMTALQQRRAFFVRLAATMTQSHPERGHRLNDGNVSRARIIKKKVLRACEIQPCSRSCLRTGEG